MADHRGDGNSDENGAPGTISGIVSDGLGALEEYGDC